MSSKIKAPHLRKRALLPNGRHTVAHGSAKHEKRYPFYALKVSFIIGTAFEIPCLKLSRPGSQGSGTGF